MNQKLSSLMFIAVSAVTGSGKRLQTIFRSKHHLNTIIKQASFLLLLLLLIGGWLFMVSGRSHSISADKIKGVWRGQQVFGPKAQGELTIDATSSTWRARISGLETQVKRTGNQIRFSLPDNQGEFRGHINSDKTITGHWIQPSGTVLFQPYATPVELLAEGKSVWKGTVRPLIDRITFYVAIQQNADGTLSAVIRNPEFGWLSRGVRAVEINGDSVTVASGFQGKYDLDNDSLSLPLVNASPTPMVLKRVTGTDGNGFYPRTSERSTGYVYHQPASASDGWETASMTEAGINSRSISDLMQTILSADPADSHFLPIHSILIARHGKLVVEEYFHGLDRDRPHDTRSAGKTLAPMLVGVAREHGAKVGPETLVYSLFQDYKPLANWDERKSKLTLADLMTMTPGLACDDNDSNSPGNENQMQSQTEEKDWYKYTLNLPMVREPGGTKAIYCSASLNLVGGVAEKASGRWSADLFYDYIAKPLQFGEYHLNLIPTGDVYTGGGAYIRPRDELKLGQLYLSGGMWNRKRVISKDWVEQSIAYHSTFIKPVVETDLNHQYGYGWHIHHFTVNGHEYREYAAEGNGGQFVIVVPELDLVVAINGGAYGNINWYRWCLEILPKYLIPAASHS